MVKISSFAATYCASIMLNSKGRIWQLSNLIVGMFAMNDITFFYQGSVSGFCYFAFIVQDWQQSLKWLHEKWKTRKNVLQKLSTNIQGLVFYLLFSTILQMCLMEILQSDWLSYSTTMCMGACLFYFQILHLAFYGLIHQKLVDNNSIWFLNWCADENLKVNMFQNYQSDSLPFESKYLF